MKKSEYKFIYQSRLQRFYYNFSIVAGMLVVQLPVGIISRYITSPNYESKFADLLPSNPLISNLMALALIVLYGVTIVFGAVMGFKIGKRFISTGTLQLYSDYATLNYGNKTSQLDKDKFSIEGGMKSGRVSFYPQQYWDIRFDGHKVRLYEAVIKFRNPRYDPSLSKAMMKLLTSGLPTPSPKILRALKKIEKKMGITSSSSVDRTFKIGDIVISKRISTPDVFANSPYYVDYKDPFTPKDEPACGCYVREVADPEHVVAEIYFEDDKDHKTPKPESVLSKSVIIYGVALDMRIKAE